MSTAYDEAIPFALPLARRFRGTTVREGVLLRVGDRWGEWAPFDDYGDVVAARWLAAALEQAAGEWPAPVRASVPVNAIVPALDPAEVAALVVDAVQADGCTTIKVKVGERGQTFADDVARVAEVRAALDDSGAADGLIRVDVNGAWTVQEAAERLDVLADVALGLEYAEQPCATQLELAELRTRTAVPIAVDEGVRLSDDLDDRALDLVRDAADVVILKAIPLGGVRRSLALAERVGRPVVVSGSLDSSVGLAAGLALAASLPDLRHACGLGTGRLLAADLVPRTLLPEDGRLSVVRPDPDLALLSAAADRMGADRRTWWLERLERSRAVLDGGAA
ncbi:MAG: o-succinylbenzoate synthase [Candidatus Nanopelagicales bacterium]